MITEKQALAVLDAYTESLIRLRNVVGVGIVEGEGGDPEDQAIGVYVEKKLPLRELAQAEVVPGNLALRLDDCDVVVPTRVIEQGPVEKESL